MKKIFSDISKTVAFIFGVNLIYAILIILDAKKVICEMHTIVFVALLHLVAIPVYFKVKDHIERPFLYRIVSIISEVVFVIAIFYYLAPMFRGWEGFELLVTSQIGISFIIISVLLDLVIKFFKFLYDKGYI